MTASLYQSASVAGSDAGFDMRLDSWRNNGGGAIAKAIREGIVGRFCETPGSQAASDTDALQSSLALLLRQRHGVRGDALPFAVSFHPGVGETISVREGLAGFRLASFFGDPGDDSDARSEHAHCHV